MIQVVQPDFSIKIGIKDGKVISLEWGLLPVKDIIKFLKLATKRLKEAK